MIEYRKQANTTTERRCIILYQYLLCESKDKKLKNIFVNYQISISLTQNILQRKTHFCQQWYRCNMVFLCMCSVIVENPRIFSYEFLAYLTSMKSSATLQLISRNIFQVWVKFSFFHTVVVYLVTFRKFQSSYLLPIEEGHPMPPIGGPSWRKGQKRLRPWPVQNHLPEEEPTTRAFFSEWLPKSRGWEMASTLRLKIGGKVCCYLHL